MTTILGNLQSVTTGYPARAGHTVFEKDQVLTCDQLNGAVDYLDVEGRLSRLALEGVGIAYGLEASYSAGKLTLTPGAGVTTDGDLAWLPAASVFDQVRLYEPGDGGQDLFERIEKGEVFELVRAGTPADPARPTQPLIELVTPGGAQPKDMVAVIYIESRVKDDDLCSGTDCDNLGKEYTSTARVLIMGPGPASFLKATFTTPHDAAKDLDVIDVNRPSLAEVTTLPSLVAVYRSATTELGARLRTALQKVYPACSGFLADLFPSDPTTAWMTSLDAATGQFTDSSGIQLLHDFQKDVAETYTAFRELLFAERTVFCPPLDRFPKWLVLGGPSAAKREELRTRFYPTPITSRTTEHLARARFLAKKLDAQLRAFKRPVLGQTQVRITPSYLEDRSLEDRAIPFYYDPEPQLSVADRWSFEAGRRGAVTRLYGYHAARWGAVGAAANPFGAQIGRFSFFRIEGHLGADVDQAKADVEARIRDARLPISVQVVRIDPLAKIVWKPPFTDLHRFHYALRQDVTQHLDEVDRFSDTFEGRIGAAVEAKEIPDTQPENVGLTVRQIAAQKKAAVKTKVTSAKAKINRPYAAYRADPTWKTDVADTMAASGAFKTDLGKIVKTEFATPYDAFLGNRHLGLLDILDQILKKKEDNGAAKTLFSAFRTDHPGVEHFGGAPPGGTFILVHDASNRVVADFTLPYWLDVSVDPPDEPPIVFPPVRPPIVIDDGIRIRPFIDPPFIDKVAKVWIDDFQTKVLPTKIEEAVRPLGTKFDAFTEVIPLITKVGGGGGTVEAGGGGVIRQPRVKDGYLNTLLEQADVENERLMSLRDQMHDVGASDGVRATAALEYKKAEQSLTKTLTATAQHVADTKMAVDRGTDGFVALMAVSNNMANLTDKGAATTGLRNVAKGVAATATGKMLNSITGAKAAAPRAAGQRTPKKPA